MEKGPAATVLPFYFACFMSFFGCKFFCEPKKFLLCVKKLRKQEPCENAF